LTSIASPNRSGDGEGRVILARVDLNFYRFRTRWEVAASPADVFTALEAVEQYPEWWPEVRAVEHLDEDRYRIRVRSLLPYDLNFMGTQSDKDPQAGVLSMRMEGDLDGFSRWTTTPHGGRTAVTFVEEVVANKALLRRLAVLGRPAFRANHALMMRHCRSGLRACLAGMLLARPGDE
jgi:hypothetical protein